MRRATAGARAASDEPKKAKGRFTVALSEKSEQMLEELKEFSDAETITEVIRDSLRLSHMMMLAQKQGYRIEICDPKNPNDRKALAGLSLTIPA